MFIFYRPVFKHPAPDLKVFYIVYVITAIFQRFSIFILAADFSTTILFVKILWHTITSTSVLYDVWNLFLFEDKKHRNDAYYWILYVRFGFYSIYTRILTYTVHTSTI